MWPADLNRADKTGTYPLFNAIYLGRKLMIEEMLKNENLDLTVKDGANRNILQAAEFYEDYEIYKLLENSLKERKIELN